MRRRRGGRLVLEALAQHGNKVPLELRDTIILRHPVDAAAAAAGDQLQVLLLELSLDEGFKDQKLADASFRDLTLFTRAALSPLQRRIDKVFVECASVPSVR